MTLCRKLALLVVVAAALVVLNGCWVTFLYPISNTNERGLIDPSLDGNWYQPDSDCNLEIEAPGVAGRHEPAGWSLYTLRYSAPAESKQPEMGCLIDPGHSIRFSGQIYQVGQNRFFELEATPNDPKEGPCADTDYKPFCAELHTVLKLVKNQDGSIMLIPISYEWFAENYKKKTLPLDAVSDDGEITNNTAALRKFLTENGDNPKIFSTTIKDKTVWRFVRPKP